jgi:hypothetical protein
MKGQSRVLDYLKNNPRGLTQNEAKDLFGISKLSTPIHRLRENHIVEIDEDSLQYLKRKIENMNQTAKLQARLYPRTSKNGTDYLAVKFKPYEAIQE